MEGNHKTREIHKKAIESGLPEEVSKTMPLKLIVLEMNYGQIDCARLIYEYASQFSYPQSDEDFWNKWHQFEAHLEIKIPTKICFELKEVSLQARHTCHILLFTDIWLTREKRPKSTRVEMLLALLNINTLIAFRVPLKG